MAVEGSLDLFQLPEILQIVAQQRKTGILTVQGADDIVAITFLDGRIVGADSLTETSEDGVGAVLVAQERVSRKTLRRLAGRAETEGKRLIELLETEGNVARPALLEALRAQTERLVVSLLQWRAGEFKFYRGEEVLYEEGFRAIEVESLLLGALEREGEESHELPKPSDRLRRLDAERPVRIRSGNELDEVLSSLEERDAIWLTPEEHKVLLAIGPQRTVQEVAERTGVDLDRVRYLAYRLRREGLLAAADAPLAAAPTPVPEAAPRRRLEGAAARERLRGASAASWWRPAAALAGAVGVALAILALAIFPVAVLAPFPWQGAERAALHDQIDGARRLQIDLAAKTYFLLEGRFPDSLSELVERELLAASDLTDSRGRRLDYRASERGYTLHTSREAEGAEVAREEIGGNFLLDPEFLERARGQEAQAPLVLLD